MYSLLKHLSTSKRWLTTTALLLCLPMTANAGFITINEAALDSIFSQAAFGNNPIDVRINPFQSIINDDFLNIDSDAEISGGLFNLTQTALSSDLSTSQSIALFFVDKISHCGAPTTNAVGCGFSRSQTINSVFDNNNASFAFVDSEFIAGAAGNTVIAHEIGHLFALEHIGDSSSRDNLLNPTVDPSNLVTTLNADQVSTIFDTSVNTLIQGNATNGYFIEISPIAILSSVSPVPEPSTYAMFAVGLLALSFKRKRA